MSTEVKKPLRRIRRLSQWEQLGIQSVERCSQSEPVVRKWTQDRTTVTNGDITLEVGCRITGYEANGISDWYVLGAEDGKLLITTKSCPEKVELRGRDGYTNGVEILNNVAMKYTNSIYADGNARSINVDDLNRVTGYNPETAGYGANNLWKYGNEVTFYWDGSDRPYYSGSNGVTGKVHGWSHGSGFYYPTVSEWIISPKSTTAMKSNKEEITKFTSTFYKYEASHYLDENSVAYQLLVKSKTYWLGSTFILCSDIYVYFGLHGVGDGAVGGGSLVRSDGRDDHYSYGIRSVVSLKSDILIDEDGKICK